MFKTTEGSTGRLLQLCIGYFVFYVITGVTVKYFLAYKNGPHLHGMQNLVYSTLGGTLIALFIALIFKWYKLQTIKKVSFLGMMIPVELLYIIPSGVLTAVVIPTTTLMYSFQGISVMVAMVVMRGAIIIISRLIDTIQIKQGILKKSVYFEENIAVAFAIVAVGVKIFDGGSDGHASPFTSLPVMIVFSSYIIAYAFRIYIMNYFKNTRPKDTKVNNNKAFFAIEQISSTIAMVLITIIIVVLFQSGVLTGPRVEPFVKAILEPNTGQTAGWWYWAIFAGVAFGIVAFFSVFIFMFKGRTATFVGLVNRLTSLVAGTTATIIFALIFGGKYPKLIDWTCLGFIFIAVYFMTRAEKKRAKEMKTEEASHETAPVSA
jgi:hypothetical protein